MATRGNPRLLKFAFEHAKSQDAEILLLFIRHVAVEFDGAREKDFEADGEAMALQASSLQLAEQYDVPCGSCIRQRQMSRSRCWISRSRMESTRWSSEPPAAADSGVP